MDRLIGWRTLVARWLAFLFVYAAVTPFLAAQSPRGTLRGSVQDASGGRISGAKIRILSSHSSTEREVETSDRGEFRIDDLFPDTYRVRVEARDFQPAEATVEVRVRSGRDINVKLKPASLHQEVTASGEASSITTQLVDVASAVQQGVVTARDLHAIPLAHRSFANIAYLG